MTVGQRPERSSYEVVTIVPTYGPAPYPPEKLASLESQTVAPHEVIVVDDGSTAQVEVPPTRLPIRLLRIDHAGGPDGHHRGPLERLDIRAVSSRSATGAEIEIDVLEVRGAGGARVLHTGQSATVRLRLSNHGTDDAVPTLSLNQLFDLVVSFETIEHMPDPDNFSMCWRTS